MVIDSPLAASQINDFESATRCICDAASDRPANHHYEFAIPAVIDSPLRSVPLHRSHR